MSARHALEEHPRPCLVKMDRGSTVQPIKRLRSSSPLAADPKPPLVPYDGDSDSSGDSNSRTARAQGRSAVSSAQPSTPVAIPLAASTGSGSPAGLSAVHDTDTSMDVAMNYSRSTRGEEVWQRQL